MEGRFRPSERRKGDTETGTCKCRAAFISHRVRVNCSRDIINLCWLSFRQVEPVLCDNGSFDATTSKFEFQGRKMGEYSRHRLPDRLFRSTIQIS